MAEGLVTTEDAAVVADEAMDVDEEMDADGAMDVAVAVAEVTRMEVVVVDEAAVTTAAAERVNSAKDLGVPELRGEAGVRRAGDAEMTLEEEGDAEEAGNPFESEVEISAVLPLVGDH